MKAKVQWYADKIEKLAEGQLEKWLNRSATRVVGSVKRSFRGAPPSAPGTPPSVVTGALRRSITFDVDVKKKEARVGPNRFSPAHQYAAIQEYGGTIRMKDKKLAVPLNRRARLDALNAYSLLSIYGLRPAVINEHTYLVNEDGTPMYILLESVRLPARPYLRPGLDRERGAIVDDLKRIKVVP